MADYTTVFDGFLPMNILEKAINETGGGYGTKKFNVLWQLNTMMYAHLTQQDSLRDIISDITTNKELQEHTGTISISQISRRNSKRDPDIFKMIFDTALARLKKHHSKHPAPEI